MIYADIKNLVRECFLGAVIAFVIFSIFLLFLVLGYSGTLNIDSFPTLIKFVLATITAPVYIFYALFLALQYAVWPVIVIDIVAFLILFFTLRSSVVKQFKLRYSIASCLIAVSMLGTIQIINYFPSV